MNNVYEFHLSAKKQASCVGDLAWDYIVAHPYAPNDIDRTFDECDIRRIEGLKGFFVRADTQQQAKKRLTKIKTPPETFFIL